jgi:hypothetical protein
MPNQVTVNNVVWDRESINRLLMTNDRAVERALLAIYARQTSSEQVMLQTTDANSIGFSGVDAEIFSSFVQKRLLSGGHLSPAQMAVCRKTNKDGWCRIGKYHKQLLQIMAERQQGSLAA